MYAQLMHHSSHSHSTPCIQPIRHSYSHRLLKGFWHCTAQNPIG